MTIPVSAEPAPAARQRGLHIALWVAQVLLAILFGLIGAMKLLQPGVAAQQGGIPFPLVLFIGACEVAGSLGLLLPSLTRIRPGLTPLAAVGFVAVMVLATLFHISRGEFSHLPGPLIFGALAAFVAWGRSRKVPIAARAGSTGS